MLWFQNQWIRVEFEGIHVICDHCGCYGHLSRRNCEVSRLLDTVSKPRPKEPETVADVTGNPRAGKTQGIHKSNDDGWTEVKNKKSRANLISKISYQSGKSTVTRARNKEQRKPHGSAGPKAKTKESPSFMARDLHLPFSAGNHSPVLTPSKRRRENAGIVFMTPPPNPPPSGGGAAGKPPKSAVPRKLFQAQPTLGMGLAETATNACLQETQLVQEGQHLDAPQAGGLNGEPPDEDANMGGQ